jgi:hypothetical protein
VITAQYNNARTSTNYSEPRFESSNITPTGFGAVSQFLVDPNVPTGSNNPVYAQPLYVNSLTIGSSTKNVIVAATLSSEVYAFDADDVTTAGGTVLWSRDERNSASGSKALFHACDVGTSSGSLVVSPIGSLPFAGVVSTPVIDLQASPPALYVVSICQRPDASHHWYLSSLNLQTGATLGSAEIAYSIVVTGGPQQTFFPANQLARPSILALHGESGSGTAVTSVTVGFGTSGSEQSMQYQGWLFAYDLTNPSSPVQQKYTNPFITECYFNESASGSTPSCSTPPVSPYDSQLPNSCGQGGGVWMSARAPAANSDGEIFFAAGNGGFQYCPNCTHSCTGLTPKITDWGESAMGINMQDVWNTSSGTAPFWPRDYFEPYSVPTGSGGSTPYLTTLNSNDWDMGVSGVVLFDNNYYLDGETQPGTSMMVTADKRGDGYVLLQSDMGQYQNPDMYVSLFTTTDSNPTCTRTGANCDETRSLAYWDGFLVAWPWFETLNSFDWSQPTSTSQFSFVANTPTSTPFASGGNAGYPGGILAITYNPSESPAAAVVWALVTSPSFGTTNCNSLNRRCPGYLLAYKLSPSTGALTQIWPDPSVPISGGSLFYTSPMVTPTAVNGKVYVPAYSLSDGTGGYTNSGIEVYACASGTGCH